MVKTQKYSFILDSFDVDKHYSIFIDENEINVIKKKIWL